MEEILRQFDPITLDEMSGIRLMNRTDTKFVTTRPMLEQLLKMAQHDYYVQEIDQRHIAAYYTVYFDTPDCVMYTTHETGHTNRQKTKDFIADMERKEHGFKDRIFGAMKRANIDGWGGIGFTPPVKKD